MLNANVFASELPDLGDISLAQLDSKKEQEQKTILREEIHEYLVDDLLLTDYLKKLGNRLAAQDQPHAKIEFLLVNSDEINAFASFGRMLGVNSGLILACGNEDMLASVMAHEIAHINQYHLARAMAQQKQMMVPAIAAALGAVALGALNSEAGVGALTATAAGMQQAQIYYTRQAEAEADRIGLQLVYKAGFNPQEFADFLEVLLKEEKLNTDGYTTEYLRTHPLTNNRIAEVKQRANQLPQKKVHPELNFLFARERLRVTTQPASNVIQYYEKIGEPKIYDQKLAWHYGYALALLRMHKTAAAKDHIDRVIAVKANNPFSILLLTEAAIENNDEKTAAQILANGVQKNPNNYPLLMTYIKFLNEHNQAQLAKRIITEHPNNRDPDYMLLKANIESAAGSPAQAYLTRAQLAYNQNDPKMAKKLLISGLQVKNLDQNSKLELQAKLDEIKALEKDK